MRLLAFLLSAALFPVCSASADLTPGQSKEAEALLAQFTAPEFAARQAAVEKLIAMGPDVLPFVKKALAGTKDSEVKLRCEMVVKALAAKFPEQRPPEGLDLKLDTTPSRMTFDAKAQPLSEALAALARTTGNAPFVFTNALDGNLPVTLSAKDKLYWETVDEALRAAGMTCDASGFNLRRIYTVRPAVGPTPPGPRVPSGRAEEEPRVYAGPAVVWVARAERGGAPHAVRSFRSDPSPGKPNTGLANLDDPDKLRVVLKFAVEHRNLILDSYVFFTKVAAADGRDLTPPPPQDALWNARPRLWGERMMRVQDLELTAPDTVGGKLSIEGVVHVDYAVGEKTLKFDDVFGDEPAKGGKATDGDLDMTLEAMQKGDHPGEWDAMLRVDSAGREDGLLPDGGRTDYGVALVDPQGNAHKDIFGWSRTGRVVGIHFHKLPKIDGDWSLTYTYPLRVESQEYPFVLKAVPLP